MGMGVVVSASIVKLAESMLIFAVSVVAVAAAVAVSAVLFGCLVPIVLYCSVEKTWVSSMVIVGRIVGGFVGGLVDRIVGGIVGEDGGMEVSLSVSVGIAVEE